MGDIAQGLRNPQPAGPGFLVERFAAKSSVGKSRLPVGARFGRPATVSLAPAALLRVCANSSLRMAKFLSIYTVARTAAGRIRAQALETRWKPLSPALPVQLPAKIVLVLGNLLRRPLRPAGEGQAPEIFQIRFQPVVFPQYSPRMGSLDERLHRTDRIGFSPP